MTDPVPLDHLRAELARHEALLDSLTVGLLLESEARRVLRANRAFCELFRIPVAPDALVGGDCAEMARAAAPAFADPEAFLARIAEVVTARELVRGDVLRMADGRILERDFVPLRASGEYLGHYWQYRDVSAREHDRRALEAARDEAERASRVKSEFLARMSHEIRTPIAAVVGFADVLLRAGADERAAGYARQIRRNADHLLGLLDDMLDLSRIESGQLRLRPEPVSLVGVLSTVDSLLRPMAVERRVDLDFVFEGPAPEQVTTDPLRLRQVLVNLVHNALKFTERGGVTVCTRMTPGPRVEVAVVDTGTGIAPEKIPLLFQAFSQVHDPSRAVPGTGLGLAISRRIAEGLGADLRVASTPGRGSTFTLSLPLSDLEAARVLPTPTLSVASPHPSPPPRAPHVLAGRSVLVVDDSADLRRVVRFFLERAGATVAEAVDGLAGVELVAARGDFDALVLDMQMPVLDGYEAAAEVRRRGFALPILALTAYAMSGDAARCLAVGCDAYLSKPVDADRLVGAVAELVRSRGSQPPAALLEVLADEDIRDLVAAFVAELPRKDADLADAVARGDAKAVEVVAHRLRGTAESYGFPDLTARAGDVEDRLRAGATLADAAEAVAAFQSAVRRAQADARAAGL